MRIPSREEVYDALRYSEATLEGDPEEFVQEVGALCFDVLNKIETLKISVAKGKAEATAAEMRTMANSLDFVRLEAGGMPHLEQLQLEELLLKASEAMAATAESNKPRPQQTSAELMRRLALMFSFWVKAEKPYKPDISEHWGKRRIDPPVVRFIDHLFRSMDTPRSPDTITENLLWKSKKSKEKVDYHEIYKVLQSELI